MLKVTDTRKSAIETRRHEKKSPRGLLIVGGQKTDTDDGTGERGGRDRRRRAREMPSGRSPKLASTSCPAPRAHSSMLDEMNTHASSGKGEVGPADGDHDTAAPPRTYRNLPSTYAPKWHNTVGGLPGRQLLKPKDFNVGSNKCQPDTNTTWGLVREPCSGDTESTRVQRKLNRLRTGEVTRPLLVTSTAVALETEQLP